MSTPVLLNLLNELSGKEIKCGACLRHFISFSQQV